MKYVDEFRDPEKAQVLLGGDPPAGRASMRARDGTRPLQIMEVCGGHTHSIFRYGIQSMLPDAVEFVHGPGCPVCVLPMGRVDDCVALAERPEVIFTTFGDAMRVPGSRKSLLKAKADGADVRMVYSPLDALAIARENPRSRGDLLRPGLRDDDAEHRDDRDCRRSAQGITNFSLFCNHITIIPTIKAILDSPDLHLDGFLGPGPRQHGDRHSALSSSSRSIRQADHRRRVRAARRAAIDVDGAAADRRRPLRGGEPVRPRSCRRTATRRRSSAIEQVFELREFFEWRGPGLDRSFRRADARALTPRSTPSASSPCRTSRSPIRRRASAARC